MIIRIVLACHDASGVPDFAFVRVECSAEVLADGQHYESAQDWALEQGYEGPFVCFDEHDGPRWLFRHFIWKSANTIPCDKPLT